MYNILEKKGILRDKAAGASWVHTVPGTCLSPINSCDFILFIHWRLQHNKMTTFNY